MSEQELLVDGLILRCQTLEQPRTILQKSIAQAVVQPIDLSLPELNRAGNDPITSPIFRPGNMVIGIFLYQLGHAAIEKPAIGNDLALR